MIDRRYDRAMAALLGVAVGDALGMPTQSMAREEIQHTYGTIGGFVDAAGDHPISGGLTAGTVTDDTEQTVLLARHLIDRGGTLDPNMWAQQLLNWEADTRARGVNDLLGPSTKRAIAALQSGVLPEQSGRFGTTNGAAMRVMPVAIASPVEPVGHLVDRVEDTCRLTHNTSEAIGAAAAVAAVASAGLEGASFEEALSIAVAACRLGERRGVASTGGWVSEALARALALAGNHERAPSEIEVAAAVGTTVASMESVPMAFAVVRLADGDPWRAAILSANLGGDTDTIGAIACGMAAACTGSGSLPPDAVERILSVNALNFSGIVADLLDIRSARSEPAPVLERNP